MRSETGSTVRLVEQIDDATAAYRGEVARRIKALRWLLGGVRPREKGATGVDRQPYEMSVKALQALPGLIDEISVDRINRAERMERSLKVSELRTLVEATEAPADWFAKALELRDEMVSSRPTSAEWDEGFDDLDAANRPARPETTPRVPRSGERQSA